MNGLLFINNRNGTRINRRIANKMFAKLDHLGPNGRKTVCKNNYYFGIQQFWTTPEDINKDKLIRNKNYIISFIGRINNRDELYKYLNIPQQSSFKLSDNELFEKLYLELKENCFSRIEGQFVVCIYDINNDEATIVRDKTGNETIYFYLDSNLFIASSEEQAILEHDSVSKELNQRTVVTFFSVSPPYEGETFFKDISELSQSYVLKVNKQNFKSQRYIGEYEKNPIRYKDYSQYYEQFEELLDAAVKSNLRSITKPSVMMSGGNDSPTIAYFSNKNLSECGFNKPLTTYSFIFNDIFKNISEEQYIDSFKEKFNANSIKIPCDDAWTLSDPDAFITNPNNPWDDLYRLFSNRLYKHSSEDGNNVMFTGHFGDDFYGKSRNDYLYELLVEMKFREFYSNLVLTVQNNRLSALYKDTSIRRIFRFIRRLLPDTNILNTYYWLTEHANKIVKKHNPDTKLNKNNFINPLSTKIIGLEKFYASKFNIELRYPYRDYNLMEFIANIPKYLLFNENTLKFILKKTLKNKLPDQIINRTKSTPLGPIYLYGIDHKKKYIQPILYNNNISWDYYVNKQYIDEFVLKYSNRVSQKHQLIMWLCLSFELWKSRFNYE